MRKSERVKKRDGGDTPLSMHLSYNNGSRMQLIVTSFATWDMTPAHRCVYGRLNSYKVSFLPPSPSPSRSASPLQVLL